MVSTGFAVSTAMLRMSWHGRKSGRDAQQCVQHSQDQLASRASAASNLPENRLSATGAWPVPLVNPPQSMCRTWRTGCRSTRALPRHPTQQHRKGMQVGTRATLRWRGRRIQGCTRPDSAAHMHESRCLCQPLAVIKGSSRSSMSPHPALQCTATTRRTRPLEACVQTSHSRHSLR